MELDRHFIERNDFSAARRGYDPDEVDRHLREIGDAVAELKRQQRPSPASLASAAAEQVRSIVELEEEMLLAADELRFEYAAKLRDEIKALRQELDEAEARA